MLDFLVRANAPHVILVLIAAPIFCSQPRWPDESWARAYAPTLERATAARERMMLYERRRWLFDRGTPEKRMAEEQRRLGREEFERESAVLRHASQHLIRGRVPVIQGVGRRTLLLAALTALAFALTDALVSPGGRLCLLPDAPSYLCLAAGAVCGPFALSWVAASDPRCAWALFAAADGVALTVLLGTRDASGALDRARLEEEREQEKLRTGAPGARHEAEAFFAAHEDVLADAYPEALFRSSLNAAIPEGIEPRRAWAAARKLIGRMQEVVRARNEDRREREEQKREEARRAATHTKVSADDV